MVVQLQSFNNSGKPEGSGFTMWNDEVRFARLQTEANGFSIILDQEDEFGNTTRVKIALDKVDIQSMQQWITTA